MTPSTSTANLMSLVGRALMALLFINFGIDKIAGFDGTVRYISSAHVPMPEVAAAIAIVVEVGLASLLLVGFKTRWVALAMFAYVAVLPFIFHAYWSVPPAQLMAQKLNFYKDLAIAGGLLGFAAFGAGAWSVDGMLRRTPEAAAMSAA